MGETHETDTLPQEMTTEKTRKERRNGMWNIFEGVDNAVLEQLGLPEEVVRQLVTEADDTVSEHLAIHQADSPPLGDCRCQRARILRSFSATVGEEMRAALQNRHRRNAVGNLFEVLTPSQKLLLVEHLQEQLERLDCSCGAKDAEASTAAATSHRGSDSNSSAIILALTELSSSSSSASSPQPGSSSVSSPRAKEEVVCR